MLAHNGLALITEKLQNQRLEESGSCCGKLPQVTQEATVKSERPRLQQHKLSVKGKNVWALSVESSDRSGNHDFIQPPNRGSSLRPPENDPSSICRHKKLRYLCQICDTAPGTPSAPPKKKHCRSLSVPPDGPSTALPSPQRDKGPKLLRPIAVLPLTNNNSHDKDRNVMVTSVDVSSGHRPGGSLFLPRLHAGDVVKLVPSSPSVDSGHFTTSDLQTPPGSPVPRPASAASDASFSSLGSAWQDYPPLRSRVSVLENRSLSLEDRISASSSPATSMPCVLGGIDTLSRCRSSSSHEGEGTSCSNTIPRCHSQPCVLHHRRCGQKRRRDCDRPTLNFNKMTETAYARPHRRSDPWNTPASDRQVHGVQAQFNFLEGAASRNPFFLNPIASSPLDSELPVMTSHLTLQDKYEGELARAANVALPLTPPDFTNFPSISKHSDSEEELGEDDDDEEEEEDEEEDSEDRDCSCHDSRQDSAVALFPLNDLDLEQIENC